MVDINLHKEAEQEMKISKKNKLFRSGPFFAVTLLTITLLAWGGIRLYQGQLQTELDNLVKQKNEEMSSFDSGDINKLVDFQMRVDHIVSNITKKDNPEDILKIIERLMVKDAFLNNLVFDSTNKTIKIEAVADSFDIAANQMLSLKKSELFDEVKLTDSKRDESGKIVFVLSAALSSSDKK